MAKNNQKHTYSLYKHTSSSPMIMENEYELPRWVKIINQMLKELKEEKHEG